MNRSMNRCDFGINYEGDVIMSFIDKAKAKVEEVKAHAHEAKADHDDNKRDEAIKDVKEDVSNGDLSGAAARVEDHLS